MHKPNLSKNIIYQVLGLRNLLRSTHELHHPSWKIEVCIRISGNFGQLISAIFG
jgi:hypothetical protein